MTMDEMTMDQSTGVDRERAVQQQRADARERVHVSQEREAGVRDAKHRRARHESRAVQPGGLAAEADEAEDTHTAAETSDRTDMDPDMTRLERLPQPGGSGSRSLPVGEV